jgi:glucose-1-phosphate cytidylyltransferase
VRRYMILRKEIFDYIEDGEELVQEPFQRLVKQNLLISYRYEGFWAPMDTLKDQLAPEVAARDGPAGLGHLAAVSACSA